MAPPSFSLFFIYLIKNDITQNTHISIERTFKLHVDVALCWIQAQNKQTKQNNGAKTAVQKLHLSKKLHIFGSFTPLGLVGRG